jgi:hypothetical protein
MSTKPKFTLPSSDKLVVLNDISMSIKRGTEIPFEVNNQIADLLGVPRGHYTHSMDGALRLRDIIFAGCSYVNLDMREYDDARGLVFLMKIDSEHFGASGDHHTRAGALLDALLAHVVAEMEETIR